jgi:UDP-N-acetylglucosamine 2-epimerase (non-hydrolysing)
VLRDVTERPSVLESGTMLLVGTDTARIVEESSRLLDDKDTYARMSRVHFPYGDGHASELIATRLHAWLSARSAAGSAV